MKIKRLLLDNFGPFEHYEIEFPTDHKAFILITGKNNAGKTSLLLRNTARKRGSTAPGFRAWSYIQKPIHRLAI